jgi:hypothetical protein
MIRIKDSTAPQFWENEDGVHCSSENGEHMLCGDAYDGEKGCHGEMKKVNTYSVTCKRCIAHILHIEGAVFRDKGGYWKVTTDPV